MTVSKTATDFGFENHDGQITADEGMTYLPKLNKMTIREFNDLITDIENWCGQPLTAQDKHDLRDVLE